MLFKRTQNDERMHNGDVHSHENLPIGLRLRRHKQSADDQHLDNGLAGISELHYGQISLLFTATAVYDHHGYTRRVLHLILHHAVVSHSSHVHDLRVSKMVFKALTQSLIAAGISAIRPTKPLP